MADKIVYLVNKVTSAMHGCGLTFIDDEALGMMLEEGWEVTTTLPDRTVSAGKKSIKATMMILKQAADNRGMTLHRGPEDGGGGRNDRNIMTIEDGFGNQRGVSIAQGMTNMLDRLGRALTNIGGAGHLGSAKDHSMPGLQIMSGEMVSKAFDVGVNAAKAGHSSDQCPFPPMSVAGQRWLQGFQCGKKDGGGQPIEKGALQSAHEAGAVAAHNFGEYDEVACPYPKGSPLREAWISGFRENGGRVE